MRNATRHPFLKSLWNIKKKQLEEQFVENRSKMLRGWMRAKPKIDKNIQKLILRQETRNLFEAMKENFKLSRRLKWMNGDYNQKGLKKNGFINTTFVNLVKIHGKGTWAFSGDNAPDGLLITPRCMHCQYFEGVRTFRKRFAGDILFTEGIETKVSKTLSKWFQKLSYKEYKKLTYYLTLCALNNGNIH